ncbi:hypothetical protein JMJ56_24045 [Belnapia sp. T18]|uniref:Eps11J n=1 Tax=Belnapia arida TaxID=2804533 RepID=A0ABS1UCV8_9PROT|nr:hypothetical protein [Belnapia arida]MBL6081086.1 hypothetical protein [Belnapia arida]
MTQTPLPAEGADTLFISASFFGYAKAIKAALEARGRRVAWFEDRPRTDAGSKALIRLFPSAMQGLSDSYFRGIAERLRGHPIRDVLIIKGEALSIAATQELRRAFPQARFTLYFWDSYRNMGRESPAKVSLFDAAYTFDPVDAEADLRLRYRPLFYRSEYAQLPLLDSEVDLLFVGTAHTDRFAIMQRIANQLPPTLRFRRVMYLPSRGFFELRRVLDSRLWRARREDFVFAPLSFAQVLRLVASARTLIDIERAVQAGLTMRTIEALGAGRKLVTTNAQILRADFYDARNICVIDRHRPAVPLEFLSVAYLRPTEGILRKYSLEGWLDEVMPGAPAVAESPFEKSVCGVPLRAVA